MAQPKLSQELIKQAHDAVKEHGSQAEAARQLGISRTTLQGRLQNTVEKLAGTSTLYDKDGEVVMQWVKMSVDETQEKSLQEEVLKALKEKLPRYAAIQAPKYQSDDLLSAYFITDYHMGMLAWGEETGAEDWDLKTAESLLIDWFRAAIKAAPDSARCVFAQMGDFLHWDGLDAVTPQHGNLLDADTRFAKLVRCAIRVTRQIIKMLLEKHAHVHIIMADANHDPASETWLREWLAAVYEDDPRVSVETSADSYYCVEHGNTSLFFHHGHKRKVANVDDVFVAKFREVFGRTKHSYAHLGHLHSNELKETNLMQVERHRTLSAPDAYAAKGGWISGRDAKVITYSKIYGEVSRLTINPDMVRAANGH